MRVEDNARRIVHEIKRSYAVVVHADVIDRTVHVVVVLGVEVIEHGRRSGEICQRIILLVRIGPM